VLKEQIEAWLKKNNVATVKAFYCGSGDDGHVNDIVFMTANDDNFLSVDSNTCPHYENLCDIISDNVYLFTPGWEINAGGSGSWSWDVSTGIIRIQHEQNIVTTEGEEHATSWNVLTIPNWIENNNG